MKPMISASVLLLCLAVAHSASAAPPTLTTPTFENVGAGMATLVLQSERYGDRLFHPASRERRGLRHRRPGQGGAGQQRRHGALPRLAAAGRGHAGPLHGPQPDAEHPLHGLLHRRQPRRPEPESRSGHGQPHHHGGSPYQPDWDVVGSAGFSAGPVCYTSLAFAPDGTPYVAYQDEGNGGKATVMRYNGAPGKPWGAPASPPVRPTTPRWPSPRTGPPTWRIRTGPTAARRR